MDHPVYPKSCEYLFEAANALPTVPRAVGPSIDSNSILLQSETREEVKGRSSTHWKGFDNNEIDT